MSLEQAPTQLTPTSVGPREAWKINEPRVVTLRRRRHLCVETFLAFNDMAVNSESISSYAAQKSEFLANSRHIPLYQSLLGHGAEE